MLSTDLYQRIKAAAQTTIEGLALPNAGGVYVQTDLETDSVNIDYPCIVLTSAGLTETLGPGDNLMFQWVFPVNLFIEDNTGKGVLQNEGAYTGWRKAIFNRFHQRRLDPSLLLDYVSCMVEPRAMFDVRLPQYQRVQSSMLLKFEAWENRF